MEDNLPPRPQDIKTVDDLIAAMEHVGEYTGPYRTVHLYADNLPGLISDLRQLQYNHPVDVDGGVCSVCNKYLIEKHGAWYCPCCGRES